MLAMPKRHPTITEILRSTMSQLERDKAKLALDPQEDSVRQEHEHASEQVTCVTEELLKNMYCSHVSVSV